MIVNNKQGVAALMQQAANMLRALGLSSVVVLSACSSTESMDLAGIRQNNLQADLERIERSRAPLPAGALTLDQAVTYALVNNLQLRVAQFEREMADDDALAERLNMLPDLTVNANRSYRSNLPTQDYLDTDGNVQNADTVGSFKNRLTADLTLTWSVLDFGMSYVRSRQAGLNAKAMDFRKDRQGQLLALEVTEAYWRAVLAEDALDYVRAVERELVKQKEVIERSAQARRLNPVAAKDASKRLVDLLITIRDLQAEVSSARLQLARLMGLNQQTNFKLARESIRPILARLPRPHQLNIRSLESYALQNRPELFEKDLQEEIREDDVRAEILSMFPDLTFGIGRNYDDNRLLHASQWNNAGVSLGWNLLKLPSLAARVGAREKGAEAARFDRMKTTVGVMTQVHISTLDYAVSVDRFLLLEESYSLTNDLLQMVREHNRVGKVSDLAVTQRLLEDVAAKLRRDRSVVDMLVSYRRLLSSIGLNVAEWGSDLNKFALLSSVRKPPSVAPEDRRAQVSRAPAASRATPVVREFTLPETTDTYAPREVVTEPVIISSEETYASAADEGGAYIVQVGASKIRRRLQPTLRKARTVDHYLLAGNEPVVEEAITSNGTVYRARYVGFTKGDAKAACNALKAKGVDCWIDIAR